MRKAPREVPCTEVLRRVDVAFHIHQNDAAVTRDLPDAGSGARSATNDPASI